MTDLTQQSSAAEPAKRRRGAGFLLPLIFFAPALWALAVDAASMGRVFWVGLIVWMLIVRLIWRIRRADHKAARPIPSAQAG